MKKMISLLLAVMLVLSFVPAAVQGEGSGEHTITFTGAEGCTAVDVNNTPFKEVTLEGNKVQKVQEDLSVYISTEGVRLQEGKYLAFSSSSQGVSIVYSTEDCWPAGFLMPPNDVTIQAALKDRTALEIDLTSEGEKEINYLVALALAKMFNLVEELPLDLDGDSQGDVILSLNPDQGKATVERVSPGADAFTEPFTIVLSAENLDQKIYALVPASSVTFQFTETQPPAEYTVTVKTEGNGTASASPGKGEAGTVVTLSQQADDGWYFKEWQVVSGGVTVGENNQFTIGTANVEVRAVFEEIPKTVFNVIVSKEGEGTAGADPDKGITGTVVTLSQQAADGWYFKEWQVVSGGVAVDGNNRFTIGTANVEVRAVFKEIPKTVFKVIVTVEGEGSAGADLDEGSAGTVVTLSQQPAYGWYFIEWQVVSGNVTVDRNNQFTIGTEDVAVRARFGEGTDLSGAKVELAYTTTTYTGVEMKPEVTVILDDETLEKDRDYTVSYENNLNAGTATVTVMGKGTYVGTVQQRFEIQKADLGNAAITLSSKKYVYNGKAHKPGVTVKWNGKTLEKGTDYIIICKKYINAGTASVVITGNGINFTGTKSVSFEIVKAKNTMTVKGQEKKVSFEELKEDQIVIKAVKVSNAKGKVTYKKVKGEGYFKIDGKTGELIIKKGTPRGKYTITVKVKAAGNNNYKASPYKQVKVKIIIR